MDQDVGHAPFQREISLLVSRISGRGGAEKAGLTIARILRDGGWDVDVRFTDAGDDPRWMAENSGSRLVGAVGGDGYMAAVGRGVALGNTGRVLVPFPGGTGNDLCRALGVGTSAVKRARRLVELEEPGEAVRRIDGMWVREGDSPVDHLTFGVVSLGLDAEANILSNQSKLKGSLSYVVAGLRAFFTQTHSPIRGTVDGVDHDFTGWIASVSNSGWVGGGINLVPSSDLDDGLLEVFHVGPVRRYRAIPLLARVLSHNDPKSALVQLHRGREIRVDSDVPMPAMADGDLVAYTPVTIRVAPGILPVLT